MRCLISLFLIFISVSAHSRSKPQLTVLQCFELAKSIKAGTRPLIFDRASLADPIATREAEASGLDHAGVLSWKPSEFSETKRKLGRRYNLNFLHKKPPNYDHTQPIGPATVNIDELYFSQLRASNASDEYTVVGNAQAIRRGELDVAIFPRLRVWRDETGKIWTLDHRRLAAMRLSGVIDEVNVEFVPNNIVQEQRFKFSTESDGRAIFINYPDSEPGKELALVIINDGSRLRSGPPLPSAQTILTAVPASVRASWTSSRGQDHLTFLSSTASRLNRVYEASTPHAVENLQARYGLIGTLTGRPKGEDSIFAKLIKKDVAAHENHQNGIKTVTEAKSLIGDGIGLRMILKTDEKGRITPKTIQKFVDQVCDDIESGALTVTEIMNYRSIGENGLPYLNDDQVRQISRAHAELRLNLQRRRSNGETVLVPEPLIIKNGGPDSRFFNGYTSFHMNVSYPNGVTGELQVRGPELHVASEIKHIFYDLKQGKPLNQNYLENLVIKESVDQYRRLSPIQHDQFWRYVRARLTHARRIESGLPSALPELPAGLPEILNFDTLKPHLFHD